MDNQRIHLGHNGGVTAKPLGSVWRGKLKIPARKIDINLAAHLSSKASPIVSQIATTIPDSLCMEIFPWRDVWPACLKNVPPTEFNIGLFFFSERRDKDVLDSLLSDAISTDFALEAKMGELELLIFTSFLLPERLQRFHGKFYLWGLFMGKSAAFYHISDSGVREMPSLTSNPGYSRCSERKDNPIHISNEQSALKKHSAQSERRGRQLDAAWSHAILLDQLRQKTECKYCGFVSEHGGISRLKAHLAGGNPRLPGCHKVSPEIKLAMGDWYSEWVKNTKVLWVKGFQGTSSLVNPLKRRLDDAWSHAKLLDQLRLKTECKYCGFVSEHGGISRLKAHLAGENPRLPGCHKVSPEIKIAMADWYSEWVKNTKALWVKGFQGTSSQVNPLKRRAQDDACEHAMRLDEKGYQKKCMYCGFVSRHGGIKRMRVHLAAGDPMKHLECCPSAPPDVKILMSKGISKSKKKGIRRQVKPSALMSKVTSSKKLLKRL